MAVFSFYHSPARKIEETSVQQKEGQGSVIEGGFAS
jgi:hypothetical protein